jgi:hypothetical protein
LLDLLIAERIVLLHSPSGAGKSSLIQASFDPALEEERFWVLPIIRVNEPPPKMPRPTPSTATSSAHCTALKATCQPISACRWKRCSRCVCLTIWINGSPSTDRPGNMALIFDQFERSSSRSDRSDREDGFLCAVGQALRDRRRWSLFALRGDYKAAVESYARPIPRGWRMPSVLACFGPDAAHEAIQEPARKAGVDFVDSAVQQLVDDLREMRVQQADGSFDERPGPNVEPVQLQVVCFRLWQKPPPDATQITDDDIESVGEVDDALAGYYSDVVQIVSTRPACTNASSAPGSKIASSPNKACAARCCSSRNTAAAWTTARSSR